MSAQEFLFALELSDTARFEAMLIDVATAVLGSVGHAGEAMTLASTLRQALSARTGRGGRVCHVRFEARAGELHVIVSSAGQPEWRTAFALPNP